MSQKETTPSTNGRDSNGRFTRGNLGGPGNPHARQVAALRQRLLEKVTAEEMDAIIDALLAQARAGDVAAAKLILQYSLGRPLEGRDPDRLDADEADAFRANAMTARTQELARLHPLALFLPLFRILIDAKGNADIQQLAGQFTEAFGADGLSGPRCPERQAKATAAPEPRRDPRQPAEPKPAAVSKREQTAGSPPVASPAAPANGRAAAASPRPAAPAPPPDSKRERTAERPSGGRRPDHKPPPPREVGRQQKERNGGASDRPAQSRTRAAPTAPRRALAV